MLLFGILAQLPPIWSQSAIFSYSPSRPCNNVASAPTVVGSSVQCSTFGTSCTMMMTNTSGNHIYVGVTSGSPGTLSNSDSNSNAYNVVNAALVSAMPNSDGLSVAAAYVADNVTGGSNTITCGSTSTTGYPLFCGAFEFHDGITASVLDKTAALANAGSGSTTSGRTPITTQAKELAVGLFETTQFPASANVLSPYTEIQGQGPDGNVAQIIATATTGTCSRQNVTFNHNSGYATAQLATFK